MYSCADCRKSIVVRVTCFSCLEEDIRFCADPLPARMVRVQACLRNASTASISTMSFRFFCNPMSHFLNRGGTESVEEVDKWNFAFQCYKNWCQSITPACWIRRALRLRSDDRRKLNDLRREWKCGLKVRERMLLKGARELLKPAIL